MPNRMHAFARDEILPSYYENALQAFLSTVVAQLRIRLVNTVTIEAVASAGDGLAAIAIDGNLRYREAAVQRAHPGGGAGTYDVFVTAAEDDIRVAPQPFSDFTDYAFDLAIVAGGGSPAIVPGVVDVHRKVAEVQWSGAAITEIRQQVGVDDDSMPLRPTARHISETPLRVRGIVGQTADLLRVEDSTTQVRFAITAGGGILSRRSGVADTVLDAAVPADAVARFVLNTSGRMDWGDGTLARDANLYRTGAAQLRTDGTLIAGTLQGNNNVYVGGQVLIGPAGGAGPWDTNLYRSAADILKTDDQIQSVGGPAQIGFVYIPASAVGSALYSQVSGEAQARFTLSLNGVMEWGAGGASARDVTLYRDVADVLQSDDEIRSKRATAGSRALSAWVAGDASRRFSIDAAGQHLWGSGALAEDVNLYRGGVDILGTDDLLRVTRPTATDLALGMIVAALGDADYRFRVNMGGKIEWGPGNVAPDTNLYRRSAGQIATDHTFTSVGAAAGDGLYMIRTDQTAFAALIVRHDGTILWGPGSGGTDTNLYRPGADILQTDDQFSVQRSATSDTAFRIRIGAEANNRFYIDSAGAHNWGAGGASAPDTTLSRSGVNTLSTPGNLVVGASLSVTGASALTGSVATGTLSPVGLGVATYPIAGGRAAGGSAAAGRLEFWDRVSISGFHAFGSFPDPGADGLYVRGTANVGGALDHDGTTVGFYGRAPTVINATPFTNGAAVGTSQYDLPAGFTLGQLAALVMTALKHLGDVNGVGLLNTTGV